MVLLFLSVPMVSACLDLTSAEQEQAEEQVQLQDIKVSV